MKWFSRVTTRRQWHGWGILSGVQGGKNITGGQGARMNISNPQKCRQQIEHVRQDLQTSNVQFYHDILGSLRKVPYQQKWLQLWCHGNWGGPSWHLPCSQSLQNVGIFGPHKHNHCCPSPLVTVFGCLRLRSLPLRWSSSRKDAALTPEMKCECQVVLKTLGDTNLQGVIWAWQDAGSGVSLHKTTLKMVAKLKIMYTFFFSWVQTQKLFHR